MADRNRGSEGADEEEGLIGVGNAAFKSISSGSLHGYDQAPAEDEQGAFESGAEERKHDESGDSSTTRGMNERKVVYSPELIQLCKDEEKIDAVKKEEAKKLIEEGADVNSTTDEKKTPLHHACYNGNVELARLLIENGAKVDCADKDGWTPLHWACGYGYTAIGTLLLDHKATVDCRDTEERTPLLYLCRWNWNHSPVPMAKLLITRGADVKTIASGRQTPLYWACYNGMVELATLLIENKADVNGKDEDGWTPLHRACDYGYTAIGTLLIENGAIVDSKDNEDRTPLLYLCRWNWNHSPVPMAKLLITRGADVKTIASGIQTPLHYACYNGVVELATLLIENGADVNGKDRHGYTPLHWACDYGYTDISRLLIEKYHAAVDSKDYEGRTPLHYVCKWSCNDAVDMVTLLIEMRAELNTFDDAGKSPLDTACEEDKDDVARVLIEKRTDFKKDSGQTALHYACEKGHTSIVEKLMDIFEADVERKDADGQTPLHYACENGHTSTAELLIDKGKVSVGSEDNKKRNPLHKACEKGHVRVTALLIEKHKVDVDSRDDKDRTPLHYACEGGYTDTATLLIEKYKVDVKNKDNDGRTPLDLACKGGHDSTAALLIKNGANVNVKLEDGRKPLHWACDEGHVESATLLVEKGADVNSKEKVEQKPKDTDTEKKGTVKRKDEDVNSPDKDVNSPDKEGLTPLDRACKGGHADVAALLMSMYDPDIREKLATEKLKMIPSESLKDFVGVPGFTSKCSEAFAKEPTPVTVYNRRREGIQKGIKRLIEMDELSVLSEIVAIWKVLTNAAKLHPTDAPDLLEEASYWESVLKELLHSDSFDDESTFRSAFIVKNDASMATTAEGDKRTERARHLELMRLLEEENILGDCFGADLKAVFAKSQVANAMRELFRTPMSRDTDTALIGEDVKVPFDWSRYNPRFMFFLEGFSKFATLMLIGFVSVHLYGEDGKTTAMSGVGGGGPITYLSEIGLLLMLVTQFVYEVGQLSMEEFKLSGYLFDPWNALDVMSYCLLFSWAILLGFPSAFEECRMVLGLSALPLSLSLLEYLSVWEGMGQLVLMIIAMLEDIRIFAFVYIVCVTGYGIAFLGIYYGDTGSKDIGDTYLYLFSSSLGNFDFETYDGTGPYRIFGIIVLTIFIVLTAVLLLNLLIARMSASHDRISEKSVEEFAFIKATNVKKFLRYTESSPLCMLPAPLNALPALVWLTGLHYWMIEKYHVSVAGTLSDFVLGEIIYVPNMLWLVGVNLKTWFEDLLEKKPSVEKDEGETQKEKPPAETDKGETSKRNHVWIWCKVMIMRPFHLVYVTFKAPVKVEEKPSAGANAADKDGAAPTRNWLHLWMGFERRTLIFDTRDGGKRLSKDVQKPASQEETKDGMEDVTDSAVKPKADPKRLIVDDDNKKYFKKSDIDRLGDLLDPPDYTSLQEVLEKVASVKTDLESIVLEKVGEIKTDLKNIVSDQVKEEVSELKNQISTLKDDLQEILSAVRNPHKK
jgi:ankyrin repeat protein